MSLSGFSAPWWFLLLFVIALLVAGYVWAQRRQRGDSLRFANFAALQRAAPSGRRSVKHVPPALLGVALVLLTVALAGPTAQQRVPRNRATVMLAVDVSLSMRAQDVEPNRLRAAKEAAKEFADQLPPGINLGLVSFAGTATVMMMPTTDRAAVKQSVDGLTLSEATATGDGIDASMSAIDAFGNMVSGPSGPPPSRIVLLADGGQTIPRDLDAPRGAYTKAKEARHGGIPISAISFGTRHGTVQIEGQRQWVEVDDQAMSEIARLSGGEFYKAASTAELRSVYQRLGTQIGYRTKHTDASRPWLVLGTLTAIMASGTALFLGRRVP